jgi:hypothetical protein
MPVVLVASGDRFIPDVGASLRWLLTVTLGGGVVIVKRGPGVSFSASDIRQVGCYRGRQLHTVL